MFKITTRVRLRGLPVSAGFVTLSLLGSLALAGCSSHNDDNNGCCASSNSLFFSSHLAGAGDGSGALIAGTNSGASAGSNPSIALSLPNVGDIPGLDDLPLDDGFGGATFRDVLNAVRDGDFRALLDALDGPRLGWEDIDPPLPDHDFQDLIVNLDALKDRLHSR